MGKKASTILLTIALTLGICSAAFANGGIIAEFRLQYPASTLNSCQICHTSPPTFNPYGQAVFDSGINFATIESLDSDGDGFSNLTEINANPSTFPGDPGSFPVVTPPPPPAAGPGTPTLVSPSGAITTSTPAYTWNALSAATDYYLWVNDPTGVKIQQWYTAAAAGCGTGTGTCSVTPTTALSAGTCTWWVQAKNAGGTGPWSASMSFTLTAAGTPTAPGAATLKSPSGTITTSTPTYTWNAVSGSTWYYLWVNDPTGVRIQKWYTAAAVGCAAGTGTCSVASTTALPSGAGKWWIQTWNSAGTGPWSTAMSFTVQAGQTSPPPADGLSVWVGKWFKITETNTGYDLTDSTMTKNKSSHVGYLKFWHWDSGNNVLQEDLYGYDADKKQWASEPLDLHYLAGSQLDFLCWFQLNDDTTDTYTGFTAHIQQTTDDGSVKTTFDTLGGYYVDGGNSVGGLTITGNEIPASSVPVPSNTILR